MIYITITISNSIVHVVVIKCKLVQYFGGKNICFSVQYNIRPFKKCPVNKQQLNEPSNTNIVWF